jgi:septum formation protein
MARAQSFILASKSPRRRQLLAALGLQFEVDAADVDETPLAGEPPDVLVCRLCRAKAAAVAARHPDAVVLAADTLVVLDGALLGKPADPLEAVAMLTALRDHIHVVYTAVCVMHGPHVDTRISATGDPLDKAGAYGIQDPQFAPVAAWDGCYSAVMGLPVGQAAEMLAAAGIVGQVDVVTACEGMTADKCCQRQGGLAEDRRERCS